MGTKKNLLLLVCVLVLSYVFAGILGNFYAKIFNLSTGFSSFAASKYWYNFFDGFTPSFIFFLILLFTAFGGRKKYWWIGILLIPAAIFEVYFDLSHIYFPIILAIVGWALGSVVRKIFRNHS